MVCCLTITSVHAPTDTPDTCWNKLPLPSTQIERPFTKIESASISSEADYVSVDAASNFVESASGGSAFDVIIVEFSAGVATPNVGGRTSNFIRKTSNVFSKNAKLFLCVREDAKPLIHFAGMLASPANLKVSFYA